MADPGKLLEPSVTNAAQKVVLLGPQGRESTLAPTLDDLGIEGQVATVTAGWQEREDELQALQAHLGDRSESLRLYERAERVFHEDEELASVHRERQDELREMQRLYELRVGHAMEAVVNLSRRTRGGDVLEDNRREAIEAVRRLDAEHVKRIRRVHRRYRERLGLSERPALQRHREEIARILEESAVLAIAGGHVAVLINRLRMFDVLDLLGDKPVVAWSGGAMVACERIILYHDSPPQGPGFPEVLENGLGLCRGVVPLPHARRRLRLDDEQRVSRFAQRYAPDFCLAMDDRSRLTVTADGWSVSPETRRLFPDGRVEALKE